MLEDREKSLERRELALGVREETLEEKEKELEGMEAVLDERFDAIKANEASAIYDAEKAVKFLQEAFTCSM